VSEKLLLERVTAAAEERHLSQNTLTAYRRTWIKAIAWAAAEGLALETLPSERAGEFYEEATRGRSASHHLQVKAALALLYDVLGSTNPFAECPAPKFAPRKLCCATTPLRNSASSCANCVRIKRVIWGSYLSPGERALFHGLFTGCRFHELARLPMDRLIREPGGAIIAVRLQLKGGSFRDLPLTPELSDSLAQWFAFLES
jgi:site-specific recombinase XerC